MAAPMMNLKVIQAEEPAPAVLELQEITKRYGDMPVLDGINFSVGQGEFVSVVGPSGSGKTTLLMTISGLQPPTSGDVVFDGNAGPGPHDGMSIVFQDYSRSLFPWRRNASNVALGLHRNKVLSKSERLDRARSMLEQVGLGNFSRSFPWQLSGGMQQRVAIARALISDPHLLLLDEPLAAVDAQTRADVQDLILTLAAKRSQAALLVTHDVEEAIYMSDRVIVLTHVPTRVQEEVLVDLPRPRNQLTTQEDPRFLKLRHHILSLIHTNRK